MKARKNLAVAAMAVATAAALSLAPAAAFADAGAAVGAPGLPVANEVPEGVPSDAPSADAGDGIVANAAGGEGAVVYEAPDAIVEGQEDTNGALPAGGMKEEAAFSANGENAPAKVGNDSSVEEGAGVPGAAIQGNGAPDSNKNLAPASNGAKAADADGALALQTSPLQAGNGRFEAAGEEPLQIQSANAVGGATAAGGMDVVKLLIQGAITGSVSGSASWGAGQLLTSLFGDAGDNAILERLEEVLQSLDKIEASIRELQTTVNSQQLDTILNNLKPLLEDETTYDTVHALELINNDQEAGKLDDAKAKANVQRTLTAGMGNSDWESTGNQSSYDKYASNLWSSMTTTYHVTIDGKSQDLTLMQIWYEHLRYKYHWENQAYEEWEAFQTQCVSLLTTSLILERASLKTRIDLIEGWNKDHPNDIKTVYEVKSHLEAVQKQIYQLTGYTGVDYTTGKNVSYPGLFSEQTWDSQYWMYKERPEYRYYWTPGHEILFYSQVNTETIPEESGYAGFAPECHPRGIDTWYTYGSYGTVSNWGADVNESFFAPFTHYSMNGGYEPLVSAEQLQMIYNDYSGSGLTLYQIFALSDQGNFPNIQWSPEVAPKDWRPVIDPNNPASYAEAMAEAKREAQAAREQMGHAYMYFVVQPDKDHPVYFKKVDSSLGQVRCYALQAIKAKETTMVLAWYKWHEGHSNSRPVALGIGVARVGPETYGTVGALQRPPKAQHHTANESDLASWWPALGDWSIGYDSAKKGAILQATMDGVLLDESDYTMQDGQILFTQAFMEALGYGSHQLVLTTQQGSHTVSFSTQADGVYLPASGDGASWAAGSGDGPTFVFKRTEGDDQTIARLIDVLVDGASVPAWGYTARSGSAIVTLTAEFMETLSLGNHTLTAVFEDGNNPEVSFTVIQAEPATKPTAPSASTMPQTRDASALIAVMFMVTALLSACVVAYARPRAKRGFKWD